MKSQTLVRLLRGPCSSSRESSTISNFTGNFEAALRFIEFIISTIQKQKKLTKIDYKI